MYDGCSTNKTGFAHRAYHNTTAHFNGYFNARENYMNGVAQIELGNKEDYSNLLPVFIYGDENASKSIYPQMDKAIEKCEKVILRHSIFVKRKEYVDWIDDCWLLIGKCYFYKQDFNQAKEKFEYVGKQFKEKDIHHEALIWLARTYLRMHDNSKTSKILDLIREDASFPSNLKSVYSAVYADYYIQQHNYKLAIPEIRNAIATEKNKKIRVRYLYILAQLYQEEGDLDMASDYYGQVAKMNPPYEMEFYAKINRALSYNVGSGNKEEIKKELKKMLRDEKNADYYDQIYFALAELYLKEGEQQKGIDLLKKSVATSRSNTNQKGISFLKLADIYFYNENPSYELAQAYYDSAVTFIDKTRADFNDILNKKNSLSRLVKDITIINVEDSLQNLALKSEKERDNIINAIIQKIIDEEEKEKENLENNYMFSNENKYDSQNSGSGANWYFYNPATISFGFSEFKRIWGDRKIEDNWRRKDKGNTISDALEEIDLYANSEEDTIKGGNDKKNKNYYIKNIPLTEKKLNLSHNRIIEAYYDLGLVYKERLNDNSKAIESFTELVTRYDTCRYVLSCYYQLYRLFLIEENQDKAEYYKNLILDKAPESEYAQLIKNPNYFKEKQNTKTKVLDFYKDTYKAFKNKYWTRTLNQCIASDSLYQQSEFSPKFHLLKALAIGKISGRDTFILELKKVVALHPDQEEGKEATRIINILSKNKNIENQKPQLKSEYNISFMANHSFILVFPNKLGSVAEIKKQIADFNKEFFRLKNFEIKNLFLKNGRTQMITVKSFPDKTQAMDYYKAFISNCEVMKDENSNSYLSFVITDENFVLLYKNKDVDNYNNFFKKNYRDIE